MYAPWSMLHSWTVMKHGLTRKCKKKKTKKQTKKLHTPRLIKKLKRTKWEKQKKKKKNFYSRWVNRRRYWCRRINSQHCMFDANEIIFVCCRSRLPIVFSCFQFYYGLYIYTLCVRFVVYFLFIFFFLQFVCNLKICSSNFRLWLHLPLHVI